MFAKYIKFNQNYDLTLNNYYVIDYMFYDGKLKLKLRGFGHYYEDKYFKLVNKLGEDLEREEILNIVKGEEE